MTVVLDAPVAAAWVLPDERPGAADAVLDLVGRDGALAPSLLWYELRNILVTAARRGRMPDGEGPLALARLRRLPIKTVDMSLSADVEVIALAERHRLTAYDAAYLALARMRVAPLATADAALRRAAEAEGLALFGA